MTKSDNFEEKNRNDSRFPYVVLNYNNYFICRSANENLVHVYMLKMAMSVLPVFLVEQLRLGPLWRCY